MIQISDTIKHIIIVNVLFFAAKLSIDTISIDAIFNLHYFENPRFHSWQLVTSIFMHASIGHIFFNMLGLYFFGTPLEQQWGRNKFLFFYFSAGIGANLIYTLHNYIEFESCVSFLNSVGASKAYLLQLFNDSKILIDYKQSEEAFIIYNTPLLGASGAIFGLLAAYAWYYPNAEIYLYFVIPAKAKYFIPVIVIADLISGITGQPLLSPVNTAYFAHVGGAIIGLIIAYFWKKNQYRIY
ncbi:rhomboid family intramembrane serine protease [Flavobacteriaceae bacterium]|nr:rhomboid family intramembrane serine protease [Flavobacteriaceae bacterium]